MSFASSFNEMKRIYGFCPCCSDVFRLSDATLITRGKPPKTIFDQLRVERERLDLREERFSEVEAKLREESRRRGQSAARRRLRSIAPFFSKRKIELRDVKVLFHPVEYVVFRGMTGSECLSVDFVDHPATTKDRDRIQRSLDRAIRAGRIDWQTFRIESNGRVVVDEHGRTSRRMA